MANPHNCLLVKPTLGQVRQTTYDLPGEGFTYGKRLPHDAEGAGKVISIWQDHIPNPDTEPGRDFKALNLDAARKGYTTAKNQTQYRMEHDIRLSTRKDTGQITQPALPSDYDLSYTYGKTVRPSTPIERLIKSEFQREWEDASNQSRVHEASVASPKKMPVAHTKASVGHSLKSAPANRLTDANDLWKMPKFSSVQHCVDDRRSANPSRPPRPMTP